LCVVTLGLAVATLTQWWNAEPYASRDAATLLLGCGLALNLYTVAQCVPLPARLLGAVAPTNADVWAHALSALRESGPTWAPLTVDPVASRVEVLKGVAYLLAFVTALQVARKRGGITFLSFQRGAL
jgi:hypothetical protein